MDSPVECWEGHHYVKEFDLERDVVFEELLRRCSAGVYRFVHFGLPRASWSAIQRMNGGTRRAWRPEGDSTRETELKANVLAARVCVLCTVLHKRGCLFVVENPLDSHVWMFEPMSAVRQMSGVQEVDFDMCMFGLRPPARAGLDENVRVKSATRLVGNFEGLNGLKVRCDGQHQHAPALGVARDSSGPQSSARVAGSYPTSFCSALARAVCGELGLPSAGGKEGRQRRSGPATRARAAVPTA